MLGCPLMVLGTEPLLWLFFPVLAPFLASDPGSKYYFVTCFANDFLVFTLLLLLGGVFSLRAKKK
jgi:hypothetical protein